MKIEKYARWILGFAGLGCLAVFGIHIAAKKPKVPVEPLNEKPEAAPARKYAVRENAVYKPDQNGEFTVRAALIPEWMTPADVEFFEDRVFVTDAYKKRVYCLNADGDVLWETKGADRFILPNPRFPVSMSPDGELWVSNMGRHRLERLDPETGAFMAFWQPNPRQAFPGCCNPVEFAAIGGGRFVTMEKGINKVRIFEPSGDGAFLADIGPDWLKYTMAFDSKNGTLEYSDGSKSIELKLENVTGE